MSSVSPTSTVPAAPSTTSPAPQPLVITALLNQTTEAVTVTPPPPSATPPSTTPPSSPTPIALPPGADIDLGPLSISIPLIPAATPPTPPTPQTAVTLTIGTGTPVLLYTDGSGTTYVANSAPGSTPPVALTRLSPPLACTLQIAPDATAANITGSGVVPIYTVILA